jgi:membrane protein DedA with SNARE-associated domain
LLLEAVSVAGSVGYPLLVVLVMAESAGIPLPGETALITAGVAAGAGHIDIALVIVLAAVAAIVGDNLGYVVARRVGRPLLEGPGPFARSRRAVLDLGEPFFARHGPKAVFLGRWILGLRTWASWLAGVTRMPWGSFLFWNAAGGISWAITVGLVGYFVGTSAERVLKTFGVIGFVVAATAVATAVGVVHVRRRRAGTPR